MNGDREIFIFPAQLTTSRIGTLTRLIHTLAICVAYIIDALKYLTNIYLFIYIPGIYLFFIYLFSLFFNLCASRYSSGSEAGAGGSVEAGAAGGVSQPGADGEVPAEAAGAAAASKENGKVSCLELCVYFYI